MHKYLMTSVCLSAMWISTASAQDAGARNAAASSEQSSQSDEQAADTASSPPPSAGIHDIIVTASRRAENVQKAALSIQALSSEVLARANVARPEDLTAIAPGVQIGSAGPTAQVYVRGVGSFGTNVFAESPVAFNLDGVYISRGWATRGMFFDLDRVEVLKGPQGTLYGRNASGGAINVITAKPQLGHYGGFVELQGGNYDLVQATAAANIPIGDKVAIRASGQIISRNGYLSDGYDDDKTESARLQVLWEPTPDFTLRVSGNYQHAHGKGVGGGVLTKPSSGKKFYGATDNPLVEGILRAQPGLGPLNVVPQKDGFFDVSVRSLAAEANWNLGFATLTLLPAYRHSTQEGLQYSPGFSVRNNEDNRQSSLEARLGNDTGSLKWVIGGYYFDEKTKNRNRDPILEILQGVNAQITTRQRVDTRSYAAFGQATYSVSDRVRLTGGIRYTYERKTDDETLVTYTLPNRTPPPLCNVGAFTPVTVALPLFCQLTLPLKTRLSFNSVTWKGGIEYDAGPQSMAFATVSTGFKSGGFFAAAPPNTYRPEKLTAYEAGIKNRFLDNRLQVNLEAFYWNYKDHQESFIGPTSIPGIYAFLTTNAGRAKSYGADADIIFHPTASDELSLKVQYNKSKYDTFSFQNLTAVFGPPVTGCAVGPLQNGNQTVDCSGKSLVRAPLWSGTAGYNHTFDLGESGSVTAGVDVQFASSAFLSVDFLDAGRQKSYAVGNFDLTYRTRDRFSVSAFMRNIWNEQVYSQAFRSPYVSPANPLADPDGLILATTRPPRTYGVRLRADF
ncbi:iron complex outermembrane receptor protein [Novosphingobium chloroacetimidivorans]|uniref:Iron complex outermembrane receptor protein n=1 Tax=Novosphingobium chloroacetimidivorans TaxID=1428314 RepID=A0A7W7NYB7_9SPHN|nr:TonB-dependent receptor [Novosphingobium chloroacetimidivorans]MBB4860299.1 iron complex outermembrane receptor protein [Novosphingobium chloroacetimidivorans]